MPDTLKPQVLSDSLPADALLPHLRLAVETSPCPMLFVALDDSRIVLANPAAAELLQFDQLDLFGLRLLDLVPEREWPRLSQLIDEFRSGRRTSGTVLVSSNDGVGLSSMSLLLSGNVIVAVDQTQKPLGQPVSGLADSDPLTGLANRRLLDSKIQEAVDRPHRHWGILFIDLNDFKRVNDAFGHIVGDRVLVEFAQKLAACSRPSDLVARYGGDEFVVLVDRILTARDLECMADRIADEAQVRMPAGRSEMIISASIGCALATGQTTSLKDLVSVADREMYRIKRQKHPR